MNNICHWRFIAGFIITTILGILVSCQPQSYKASQGSEIYEPHVLIINSDKSVEKYATIQREFEAEVAAKTIEINLATGEVSTSTLQKEVTSIQPAIVYAIGSKAYLQASKVTKGISLIFSSLINWRRFDMDTHNYGISLELPAEMLLFMCSYLFPDIQTLGVLYSQRHNRQWFELAVSQAEEVGITLQGKTIESPDETAHALKALLPQVDAIWLISDPIVLYDTKQVQNIFAEAATNQKPIFAYNALFIKYGAMLTIAADIPTMGRQAAGIAKDILKQQPIDEPVQFPAGSHITLNLKKGHEYGITINHAALSSVERIIQ